MTTYLSQTIKICQIYPISKFTSSMREDGFGPWCVDVGDTEVPIAREYYEKLCNVKSWAELEQILCCTKDIPSAASKMDLKKLSEVRDRAIRLINQIDGSIARMC